MAAHAFRMETTMRNIAINIESWGHSLVHLLKRLKEEKNKFKEFSNFLFF
jgi:hypothetical protein